MIPHVIRDSVPGDRSFVLRTWKLQLVETQPFNFVDAYLNRLARSDGRRPVEREPVPHNALLGSLNLLLDQVFSESRCRVACAPSDDSLILGFVVAEPMPMKRGTLHCVYTKSAYRRFGLGRALLHEFDGCTAATMWPLFAEAYGPRHGYTYEPSRLWSKPPAQYTQREMR